MTKKKTHVLHAEIIATYIRSIDWKMKGEQLRCHTAWQVLSQLEGETAAFACLYTTDHKCMIPTLPPPTSTSPSPTTSRVNRWRVWSNEIHEDRDNHLRVHDVHSLIWMMIHIGREVNSPGDTANGRTCKRYRAKSYVYGWMCVSIYVCGQAGRRAFTWGCFAEHIICNLSLKLRGGGRLSMLGIKKQSLTIAHQKLLYSVKNELENWCWKITRDFG